MTSTGSTILVDGQEFVVVWNGEVGLIGDRLSKPGLGWTPPNRAYNKTGNHVKTKQLDLSDLGDDDDGED